MTKIQILTAALEEMASGAFCHGVSGGNCPTGCPRDKARAALEAAAKVPGLAQDEALVDNASYAVYEATKATPDMSGACRRAHGDMENIRVARAVLRAIDAYQRGGK